MATAGDADIDGLRKQIRANAAYVFSASSPPGRDYGSSSNSDDYLGKIFKVLTIYDTERGYCAVFKCWCEEEDRVVALGEWSALPQATLESLLRVLSEKVLV